MSIAQTIGLIQQVKELELIAKKNTTGMFAGNYLSTVLGHGMEFHEARKYVEGESIRLIDWNMTARLGEVYVKKFREEREREIFIGVDISPSMFFGTQKHTKYEVAMEVAATLGYSAISNNDKLGLVCFNSDVTDTLLPQKGKSHYFRFLKTMVEHKKDTKENKTNQTNVRSAIETIQKQKAKKYMIFLISDFIEHDIPEDLKLIQNKHDVVMIHIYDPFEFQSTKKIKLSYNSPEGAKLTSFGHPGSFATFDAIESFLKGSSLRYGIDVLSISTKDIVSKKLMGYFKDKQRRRSR